MQLYNDKYKYIVYKIVMSVLTDWILSRNKSDGGVNKNMNDERERKSEK